MSKVVVEMTADEAQLFRAMGKIVGKQKEMEAGYGGVRRASKKAGQEAQNSGTLMQRSVSQSLQGLKAIAGNWGNISAAVGQATAAIRAYDAARQAAAQGILDTEPQFAQLAQLAIDDQAQIDPKQFADLMRRARQLGAQGVENPGDYLFAFESAGIGDFAEKLASLGASRSVGNPQEFVAALEAVRRGFGEEETGDLMALANKAFAASKMARAKADQLAQATVQTQSPAKALGLSDEEVFAAASAISAVSGTADTAATQLTSLLQSVSDAGGFAGKDLAQIIDEISAKGLAPAELSAMLGRKEASAAFATLTGKETRREYEKALAFIRAAEEGNLATELAKLPATDPALRAAQEARRAKAERELAGQGAGVEGLEIQAAIDRAVREVGEATGSGRAAASVDLQLSAARIFLDKPQIEGLGRGFVDVAESQDDLGVARWLPPAQMGNFLWQMFGKPLKEKLFGDGETPPRPKLNEGADLRGFQSGFDGDPALPARAGDVAGAGTRFVEDALAYSPPGTQSDASGAAPPMRVTADSPAQLNVLQHIAGTLDAILSRSVSTPAPRARTPVAPSSRANQLAERAAEIA